jgi:heme/copper-type cytochrome/quinol oxidase subunit 2
MASIYTADNWLWLIIVLICVIVTLICVSVAIFVVAMRRNRFDEAPLRPINFRTKFRI